MVLSDFEVVFVLFCFLPAVFKATTYQRASLSVCSMCVGKQLVTEKIYDSMCICWFPISCLLYWHKP